jgi:O-antigen/teichoic acid export membrane protein/glycosyltransferase involved in cell wall biosynthesis
VVAYGEGCPRTVLLIAYHFPPIKGSSGVQRTLRFAQHLPRFGWRPIVLTIDPLAYEERASIAGNEVPEGLQVYRAFGLDVGRHLAVWGRYPRLLALPDRWATWRHWAIPMAQKILREHKVDAIWSTYPIATAHQVALEVATNSDIPWVAEFRDPMWEPSYPPDPVRNKTWLKLEQEIFARADRIVVTAPGAAELYAQRYPQYPRRSIEVIENGYDEETFARAEAGLAGIARPPVHGRPVTLLHSGIIYAAERDPIHFFAAVAALKSKRQLSARDLRIVLRASGNEADYRRDLNRFRISDIVQLAPPIDYLAALKEMFQSDGLLILQAANCNAQVPAKLYEYFRARRPILALTDSAGDTARAVMDSGVGLCAPLNSAESIERALHEFVDKTRQGQLRESGIDVAAHSRMARAGQLASSLDALAEARPVSLSDTHKFRVPAIPEAASGDVARGAAWMIGARFGERLLGLISTAVLARLLAPSDFGLVAIALGISATIEMFGAFGFDWALVRQPRLTRSHLDTAWTIRTAFGVLAALLLTSVAGIAADAYREPELHTAILIIAFTLFVGGIENPGIVMFRRDLKFQREFVLRLIAKVSGTVVSLALAVIYGSYLALLWGMAATRVVTTVLSYTMHEHRPRFSVSARTDLFSTSIWLLLANVLGYVRGRWIGLLIGRMLGTRTLGLFSVATDLADLAATEVAAPINRAVFSDYARTVQSGGRIGESYLNTAPVLWLICLPIALGIYIVAPQLVHLLLGENWTDAVQPLKLLSLAGALTVLSTNAIFVYWACGRARLETWVELVAAGVLVAAMLALIPVAGVMGAALAVVISNGVVIPVHMVLLRRYFDVDLLALLTRSWRVLVGAGVLLAVGSLLPQAQGATNLAMAGQFVLNMLISAAVYLGSVFGLWWISGRPEGPERHTVEFLRRGLRA